MSQEVMERKDRATLNDQQPTRNAERHAQGQEPRRSGLFLVLVVIVLSCWSPGGFTLLQRRSQYEALANKTETLAIPTVSVVHPIAEADSEDLVLPSTLQAYVESPIYARTSGYLKKWYHDIGSACAQGELLADIDAPEIDQQLAQSRAELGTAQANQNLSQITASRYRGTAAVGQCFEAGSRQCHRRSGREARQHAIGRSQCAAIGGNWSRFKHIYAPFSGVITRRNVDIGNLMNAGNGGSAQELFFLAQTDPIRVFVNVPENYAPTIHVGLGRLPGTGAISRTEISRHSGAHGRLH